MRQPDPVSLASLQTLFETKRGKLLPLPPKLARLYGRLRMPLPRSHPYVFSNKEPLIRSKSARFARRRARNDAARARAQFRRAPFSTRCVG